MEIKVTQMQGRIPVTILSLEGDLDGSSYLRVIDQARNLYQGGVRGLLLDMAGVPFVSSAGLVAIHSVALLMQGQRPPDTEHGWAAFGSMSWGPGAQARECLKLLNLQPRVAATLEKVGFMDALEVYTNLDEAIASF